MKENRSKLLVLGIALIMVVSVFALFLPGVNNASQNNTKITSYVQSSFEKSLSTGTPVQMNSENLSAVQNQLSKYSATPMSSDQIISFMVSFKITHNSQLTSYITQEKNPMSPFYHHYLTSSDFQPGALYGPNLTAYNDAIQYYTGMGFTLTNSYDFGLQFQGNISQVNAAFHTSMMNYIINGVPKFANSRPLEVPSAFSSSVSSIDGLTNLLTFKPLSMVAPAASGSTNSPVPSLTSSAVTQYLSQAQVLNYSKHSYAYANIPGYGLTQFLFPTTMPKLYNATGLVSKGYNGKGITIAVVMCQGYNPSDLQTFSNEVFGNSSQLLNRITNMPVNGALPISSANYWTSGGAGEFTLDLEYSSTMAPGAHIDAVYGPSLSTMSLDTVYMKLTSLTNTPQIVTNSWGGDEALWFNLYGPSYQNAMTMNSLFKVLNSMGSTVLFSSGDSAGVGALTGFLTGSFGASSPYVVSVGGVRTLATSATGIMPTGNVSNFTLSPYASNAQAGGFWFPNFHLNISSASGIATQSYWYSPSGSTVPFAGGQVGLSYWFNQSAYQHGPGIPNSMRQNSVTVSAEADFNETEYFGGMWVFFWGGTSFACPTTAGELADILSYLNATNGYSHFGNADNLIYQMGNFQNNFNLDPFYSVTNGSNPWAAANQNIGWPNDMTYPANWTVEHKGYTLLTGWGTINVYNFAIDASYLLSHYTMTLHNSTGNFDLNSAAGITLSSGVNYTLQIWNTTTKAATTSTSNTVTASMYYGNGTLAGTSSTTTTSGKMYFNTAGLGGYTVLFKIVSGSTTSYRYVFINQVLSSGKLKVTLMQNSIMGGFAAYNNLLSPGYPGFMPLMPNTVEVEVTLNGTPVANAYVLAIQDNYSPVYTATNESSNAFRSVGFTNSNGIAMVETWNVMNNATYNIQAYYEGLTNSTNLTVLPQYGIMSHMSNTVLKQEAFFNGLICLPAATYGTSYTVPLQVFNANYTKSAPANISVGEFSSYPGFLLQPMTPTTSTSSNGLFNLTINSFFAPGLYYIQITTPNQGIQYYNGLAIDNPSTYFPIFITGSVGGSFLPNNGFEYSDYIGTGWTMSGMVETNCLGMYINGSMTTGPMYHFDNMAPTAFPVATNVSTDPQNALLMDIPIPTSLPLGYNTFTVTFNDTLLGLNYTYTNSFYIISSTLSTQPVSSFSIISSSSPSVTSNGNTYYYGNVTFGLKNNELNYTNSMLQISNAGGSVMLTIMVSGLSSYTYNFANLGPGTYTVTYTVMNYNGQPNTSSTTVNANSALAPTTYTVTFKETGLSSGTSWGVVFNGKAYNSTSSTLTLTGISAGTYNYSFTGASGYNSPGSSNITITSNASVNAVFSASGEIPSTEAYAIAGATAVIGILVGVGIAMFLRKKA